MSFARSFLVSVSLLGAAAAAPVAASVPTPPGFLWGTATAAHQTEGGNTNNDWSEFEQTPGNIHDGDQSGQAADHWNRFAEDLDLALQLGNNSYRFSVEWSRIEPQPGVYDPAALEHYREVAAACRARDIEPMVTLLHFTLPRWAAAMGGLRSGKVVKRFQKFAAHVGAGMGDLVDLWCTINEPMVVLSAGYLAGVFPPGRSEDMGGFLKGMVQTIRMHRRAYKALHRHDRVDASGDGTRASVGIAKHNRIFQPARPDHLGDKAFAFGLTKIFNDAFVSGCLLGRVHFTLPGGRTVDFNMPFLGKTLDYFGLNYYSRDLIQQDPDAPGGFRRLLPEGAPVTELDWEIYPEGLYQLIMDADRHGLPIYITENGLADADDDQRADFLRGHLEAVGRAVRDGADVRGYYHWSLMDNFEWAEGFWPRFGLFAVDYATQQRTRRPSADVYQQIIESGQLPTGDRPVAPQPMLQD